MCAQAVYYFLRKSRQVYPPAGTDYSAFSAVSPIRSLECDVYRVQPLRGYVRFSISVHCVHFFSFFLSLLFGMCARCNRVWSEASSDGATALEPGATTHARMAPREAGRSLQAAIHAASKRRSRAEKPLVEHWIATCPCQNEPCQRRFEKHPGACATSGGGC